MKSNTPAGRKKPRGMAAADPLSDGKPAAPVPGPIPVCLGEFLVDEARAFCPLWEATWSQDARGKPAKK